MHIYILDKIKLEFIDSNVFNQIIMKSGLILSTILTIQIWILIMMTPGTNNKFI